MDKYVYINTDAFKTAIRRNGFNLTDMSRMFDKHSSYIGSIEARSGGRIELAFLEKVCLVLREKPESFIVDKTKEKEEKEEKATTEAAPTCSAEIEQINDAMASLVRMMETTMNTVKRISDEVSTIKDTEYAASQESRRFYQEGHVTFKTLINWIKAGWKQ